MIPPGIALLKGTSFHRAAEANMEQKLTTHRDLPAEEIVEIAVANFEQEAAGDILLTDEEASRGPAVVLGEAKDQLAELAETHAKQQAPEYQPALVEKSVRIELPEAPRDLVGIIDLVDDRGRVIDFKTATRRRSQSDADSSVQLTVYAAAYECLHGVPPTELRLDCVVQTKTQTTRQVLATHRSREDFAALARRINAVTAAIEAGVFPPTNPGNWWCSPTFCGYWHDCPYRPRTAG
ncbi:MAG: PD-(D/E)XK nuclease family protein [Planctomycetes bacterium]|nr:PD-(D/E)XK nuclease family protein [Planctomycetota bacterium]